MRGIMFGAPMIARLNADAKTQTRRPVKWEPGARGEGRLVRMTDRIHAIALDDQLGFVWTPYAGSPEIPWPADRIADVSPYGGPGARLWVREALKLDDGDAVYAADGKPAGIGWTWKTRQLSPIFMPHSARRFEIELATVRIEKLQVITNDDAVAEGAFYTDYGRTNFGGLPEHQEPLSGWSMVPTSTSDECLSSARMAFGNHYNHIHGGENWNLKPGQSPWDENPWVWRLEFKLHRVNR